MRDWQSPHYNMVKPCAVQATPNMAMSSWKTDSLINLQVHIRKEIGIQTFHDTLFYPNISCHTFFSKHFMTHFFIQTFHVTHFSPNISWHTFFTKHFMAHIFLQTLHGTHFFSLFTACTRIFCTRPHSYYSCLLVTSYPCHAVSRDEA